MKLKIKKVFALVATVLLVIGVVPIEKVYAFTETTPKTEQKSTIEPLQVSRTLKEISAVNGIQPYSDWYYDKKNITADLSSSPELAYSLTFSNATVFPAESKLPDGYNPKTLLEWGKAPGLNIDILHKHGFTGKGAVIAYVDQPIPKHEQYNSVKVHYTNNTNQSDSMHGPAVLSLLAGKDIGTAPKAEIYYYAHEAWKADQKTHAECLRQIIEQNKRLPEGKKITMVGFSDNIDPSEKNTEAFKQAVKACEEAGIMVWFCGEYGAASFIPYSDKNNYQNLISLKWSNGGDLGVYIPSSGRTTAYARNGAKYVYWAQGGLSWTMPYVLGLYGTAITINPKLTQNELRTLLKQTAYDNNGMKIINPVGFIAEVLKGVGRNAEADAMLKEVAARSEYLYAVMPIASMSEEDISAVNSYLASITDATVLVVDAGAFASEVELYDAMKADATKRGGKVVGVQIFGTSSMVPAFKIKYKVQMTNGIDDGDIFLSDLFYGNFKNDSSKLASGYNVMDHFAQKWDVTLIPEWPVVRLPLEKGQYKAFFDKYNKFVQDSGLERLDIVNFSNPIFASSKHIDDMGQFLNRMSKEFKLLKVPYRLYGNKKGDYPVTTKVLGDFTASNLTLENTKGMSEMIINTHGQWNNIDQTYFTKGEEKRSSLVNMDNINQVLNKNVYYLDTWTCLNGYGMGNNLTTTALNGKAIGVFSATTIISNNGVNNLASVSKMKESNFYYFYYSYLKALNDGKTRHEAFFEAQKAYGNALMENSKKGIRSGEGNYQFNLNNLLAYHNFGVIEPNSSSVIYTSKATKTIVGQKNNSNSSNTNIYVQPLNNETNNMSDGTAVEKAWNVTYNTFSFNKIKKGTYQIYSVTAQKLNNGYYRFNVDFMAPEGINISVFNPPNGNLYMYTDFPKTTGKRSTITFDVKEEYLAKKGESLTLLFYSDSNRPGLNFSWSNQKKK